jgi:vancomycin resistance protein YoaR
LHVEAGTQSVTLERRKRQARVRKARRVAVATLVALVTAAVAVGLAFAGSARTIASGISVGGVAVGGMTVDDALRALRQRSRTAADTPVAFVAGGQRFSFTARELGIAVDWRAAIEQARQKGDGFGPIRGFRRLALRFSGQDVALRSGASEATVASAVRAVAAKVDRRAVPATIELKGLTPSIVPGRAGQVLDRAVATRLLVSSLAAFAGERRVALPLRIEPVRVTAASLAPVLRRLRTMLSAPVRLRYRAAYASVTPRQLASMIEVPAAGQRRLTIGGPASDRILDRLTKLVDRPAVDATFSIGANGLPRLVPSHDGLTLDRAATTRAILSAAASATSRVGRLAVEEAKPKRTTAQANAMGIKEVVGTYETTYGGIANRLHNVRLVAKLVDDHYIAPGATFSFNRTTGERSADKGFLEAPVIINGELQSGIGGGVCQVSTTVFNAAYEAGLKITERTNHALYISHYPLGRDATVDYPSTDLQFVNDTKHWIWLRAFIGDSSLRVSLFGTSPDRRVETETAPLHAIGGVPIKNVPDPELLKGKKVVDTSIAFSPPLGTSVHRRVYDKHGKLLYDTVWTSSYRGQPKVVHVGTKPKPKVVVPPGVPFFIPLPS